MVQMTSGDGATHYHGGIWAYGPSQLTITHHLGGERGGIHTIGGRSRPDPKRKICWTKRVHAWGAPAGPGEKNHWAHGQRKKEDLLRFPETRKGGQKGADSPGAVGPRAGKMPAHGEKEFQLGSWLLQNSQRGDRPGRAWHPFGPLKKMGRGRGQPWLINLQFCLGRALASNGGYYDGGGKLIIGAAHHGLGPGKVGTDPRLWMDGIFAPVWGSPGMIRVLCPGKWKGADEDLANLARVGWKTPHMGFI